MPVTYNYSIIANFPSGVQEGQLLREIEADSAILVKAVEVTVSGDDVDVIFESTLPANQETALNIVVAAHVPITAKESSNITFKKTEVETPTYKMVVAFGYKGSREAGMIESFKVVTKKDETATDYSIRIYDLNHNNVLAEDTYTNTKDELHIMTMVSNVPENEALLELHMKVNGSGKAYLEAASMVIV